MQLRNFLIIGTLCTTLCLQNVQALDENGLSYAEQPVTEATATLERCKSITPMVTTLFQKELAQATFITRLKFRWNVCCLKALSLSECKTLQNMAANLKDPLLELFQGAFLAIDAIPTGDLLVQPAAPATATPARTLVDVATAELYDFIAMVNGNDHPVPQATQALISTMGYYLEPIINDNLTPTAINDLIAFFKSPIWMKLRASHHAFHEALFNTLSTQGQAEFKDILMAMSELI